MRFQAMLVFALTVFGTPEPARGQQTRTTGAGSGGRLVSLYDVDFNRQPELLPLVDRLNSTFQIMALPEAGTPAERGVSRAAAAPPSEGGQQLRALCTASLVAQDRVVTADHCLRSKNGRFQDIRVLRRHLFRVVGGRLMRTGYEDYRFSGQVLSRSTDLAVVTLARPAPFAAFPQAPSSYGYPAGDSFLALGYPNEHYGKPYVSLDCRISSRNGLLIYPIDYGGVACPIEGGMSGGPQIRALRLDQIGINSLSGGAGLESSTSSPRVTRIHSEVARAQSLAPAVASDTWQRALPALRPTSDAQGANSGAAEPTR